MSAYTVHRLLASGQRVVMLQYPGLDTGGAVIVAPLFPDDKAFELDGVTPRIRALGETFLLAMHLMAAVRLKDLGPPEEDLTEQEYMISKAINRLFFGI